MMTGRARRWHAWIEGWRRSGLSQAEFCRRRGLNQFTFSNWKAKLASRVPPAGGTGEAKHSPAESKAGRFLEISPAVLGERLGYEIVLGGDRVLRIPVAFDPQAVTRLIAAVEAAC